MKQRFTAIAALAVLAVLASLALAACGGSSDSPTSSTTTPVAETTESSSQSADYQQTLDSLYKGEFTQPPKSGPPAQRGKNVWYISCGQASEACVESASAFQAAAKKLDWNVTLVDSKVEYSLYADGIRRAIAAGADGIVPFAADCTQIKSALEDAKKAEVPVVTAFASDCGNDGTGGEPLFTAETKLHGANEGQFRAEWGKARADYTIALTKGEGNIIYVAEQTHLNQKLADAAYEEEIETTCPGCKLTVVPYTFAEVGPTLTSKVQAAMAQEPQANVLAAGNDYATAVGLAPALKQSHKEGKIMMLGGDGGSANYQLIREGVQTGTVPYSYQWANWAIADTLNRVFAGEDPATFPDEGDGWQAIDLQHNLPAEGEGFEPPVDYQAAYSQIWAGG